VKHPCDIGRETFAANDTLFVETTYILPSSTTGRLSLISLC